MWLAVTSTYYDVLHSLEEEGLLDISNTLHIFLVIYVFLPRLHCDLCTFTKGWNHHPLRTEGNMTPQQLWQLGLLQNSTDEAENVEVRTFSSVIFVEHTLIEAVAYILEYVIFKLSIYATVWILV